jgi:hypothetical protein
LLIVDLRRLSAPLQSIALAVWLPFVGLFPYAHDGFISLLRAYSPSALRALACYADSAIIVEFHSRRSGPIVLVASRARRTSQSPGT